jgi:hypothetical protein
MLPCDRVVAVVDLEGGGALAFDDGGTMQVRETAAELEQLLEVMGCSVVGTHNLELRRRELELEHRLPPELEKLRAHK